MTENENDRIDVPIADVDIIGAHKLFSPNYHATVIYTDGGYDSEEDIAIWGYLVMKEDRRVVKVAMEPKGSVTQMEILAVVNALSSLSPALRDDNTLVVTDSADLVRRIVTFRLDDWYDASHFENIAHGALWKELYEVMNTYRDVRFQYVKSHHFEKQNEFVHNQIMNYMNVLRESKHQINAHQS
jgi:ribonuclease HI